jgi:hypothetical protein
MGSNIFRNSYLAADLTFQDDKITWHCPEVDETREVMMEWETPIMNKMAEVTVSAGDHVLECGFGMGILSDAVQARNPASHTIVECHPDVIIKLKEWAADKPSVIIKEGKWMDLLSDEVTRYDAILMDTYVDDDLHYTFRYFCKQKANKTCKISWWNFSGGTTDDWMMFYWKNVSFTEVAVDPPENSYYNRKTYHVPLKQLTRTEGFGIKEGSVIYDSASSGVDIKYASWPGDRISCADPSNPSLENKSGATLNAMKCQGLFTLNTDLISGSAKLPMIVKRNNNWIDVVLKDVVAGDILYTLDGEVEVTSNSFDNSEANEVHKIYEVSSDFNYFVNKVLIRKSISDA